MTYTDRWCPCCGQVLQPHMWRRVDDYTRSPVIPLTVGPEGCGVVPLTVGVRDAWPTPFDPINSAGQSTMPPEVKP